MKTGSAYSNHETEPEAYDTTFELRPSEALDVWTFASRDATAGLVNIYHDPTPGPTARHDCRALDGQRVLFTTYGGEPQFIANIHTVEEPANESQRWSFECWCETATEFRFIPQICRGPFKDRIDNPADQWRSLERAFAEEWVIDNDLVAHPSLVALNSGSGTLGDLAKRVFPPGKGLLTQRERLLCAALIQWLGTPCGEGFLCNVFNRAGYSKPTPPRRDYAQP